jgi:metal-responsive CopG/Arc/MetJ family transcriptional regulator
MTKSTTVIPRKKRGPAPTGKGTPVMVRLQPDMLASLDEFISEQVGVSRPEAIRMVLQDWLLNHGYGKPDEDGGTV